MLIAMLFLASAVSPLLSVANACGDMAKVASSPAVHHQHGMQMGMNPAMHAVGSSHCHMPCCDGSGATSAAAGSCQCAGAVCGNGGLAVPATVAVLLTPRHDTARRVSGCLLPDTPVSQVPTPPPRFDA